MAERLLGQVPDKSARKGATVALLLLTGLNLFNYLDRYILPGVQPLVQKGKVRAQPRRILSAVLIAKLRKDHGYPLSKRPPMSEPNTSAIGYR
jgi:hypothetical protein